MKITRAKALSGLRLEIEFADQTIQLVDFSQFLKSSQHPEIKKYAKMSAFANFRLINGELMWGDFDLIFPMIDLYENKISQQAARTPKAF